MTRPAAGRLAPPVVEMAAEGLDTAISAEHSSSSARDALAAVGKALRTTYDRVEHSHDLSDEAREQMAKFEALDFEVVESDIYRASRKEELPADTRRRSLIGWFLFAATGVCTGTLAFTVAIAVEHLIELRFGTMYSLMEDESYFVAYLADVVFACAFVAIASCLVAYVEPASAGSGIPEAKSYLNGSNIAGGFLTMRALVVKAVGVGFSVAGGLCVGKEGPLVHSGSCVAANLSHGSESCSNKDWKRMQNDLAKRDYVSGGCAAGVAAAFGAPIGGVLFSLEEASSFMSLPLLWRMFLAAM